MLWFDFVAILQREPPVPRIIRIFHVNSVPTYPTTLLVHTTLRRCLVKLLPQLFHPTQFERSQGVRGCGDAFATDLRLFDAPSL